MKTKSLINVLAYTAVVYGVLSVTVHLVAIGLTQWRRIEVESSLVISTALALGISIALISGGADYIRRPKRKSALSAALAGSLTLSLVLHAGVTAAGAQQYVGPALILLTLGVGFACYWFMLRKRVLQDFPEE